MFTSNTLGSGVLGLATGVCGVETALIDDESAAVVVVDAVAFDDFVELSGFPPDASVSSDVPLIFSTAFEKFARLSDDVSLPRESIEQS